MRRHAAATLIALASCEASVDSRSSDAAPVRADPDAPFEAAELITELAAPGLDNDAWISPDRRTLLFTSNRDGTVRLWQATR